MVEWANQNFLGHGLGRISALEKKNYWKYVVVMDSKSWHCLTWNSWNGLHRNLLPHISTSAEANPLPTFAFKIFNHYADFQCKRITTKTNHDMYSHMFFFGFVLFLVFFFNRHLLKQLHGCTSTTVFILSSV